MKATLTFRRRQSSGQTLIIALAVLGVLLVLGAVFLGFVNRSIVSGSTAQKRSVADDLAQSGVTYAHAQLQSSPLGADWRPTPTAAINGQDPDLSYLQAGGPDGLGAYSRIEFNRGRALIRVRYAPTEASLLSTTNSLRNPAAQRSYIVIESVGRSGEVKASDPTTLRTGERAQERKLIAYASVGLIDQGRFITNIHNESRAAEIGMPTAMGSTFVKTGNPAIDVALAVPVQMGQNAPIFDPTVGLFTATSVATGGGLRVNTDLIVHGTIDAYLNKTLGDGWNVYGLIRGADSNAQLRLNVSNGYNAPVTTVMSNGGPNDLDSRGGTFRTNGVVRDGVTGVDADGIPRGIRKLEAPNVFAPDKQTGTNRYVQLTAESGVIGNAGNSGRFGQGQNIYVDNVSDLQMRNDESGRIDAGTNESLLYDWLNPNNGRANSGWRGAYYVPTGAYLQLLIDGFSITRNSNSPNVAERTWKAADGTDSGSSVLRFRLGRGTRGDVRIVNGLTPGISIAGALAPADFDRGQPFGGVLYFEGNVRVRGTIATNVPMTVVSGGTIYIDGSITKGVLGNDVTVNDPVPAFRAGYGLPITTPSRSMLMLIARQYVAVNTTQFVGPSPGQALTVKGGSSSGAVQLAAGGGANLSFRTDLLLDPVASPTPLSPSTWVPFSTTYTQPSPANLNLPQQLLITHAMDDSGSGAPASWLSMDVNFGLGAANTWNYLFPLRFQAVPTFPINTASTTVGRFNSNAALAYQGTTWIEPGHTTAGMSIIYGIGGQPYQRFPKFESINFNLFDGSGFAFNPGNFTLTGNAGTPTGSYTGLMHSTNEFTFRANPQFSQPSDDYLIARTAIVPLDVKIEASVYAQEGSFFIIPGPGFNTNPNDRRDTYEARVATLVGGGASQTVARDTADQERADNFGSMPGSPFYGEPLDIKVDLIGSISENMPPSMSVQAEWLRKWGWIPRWQGAERMSNGEERQIPRQHFPGRNENDPRFGLVVPNFTLIYDPALATGRPVGFDSSNTINDYLRRDANNNPLPPMPRLPVSPTLSYFGEVNP